MFTEEENNCSLKITEFTSLAGKSRLCSGKAARPLVQLTGAGKASGEKRDVKKKERAAAGRPARGLGFHVAP